MTSPPMTRGAGERRAAVGVDELRRAWLAVQAGRFRRDHPSLPTADPAPEPATPPGQTPGGRWEPVETVVAVLGCTGPTASPAVALALATAAGTARVVDCVSPGSSGLAAASTAELGRPDPGWVRGSRGRVLIERVGDPLLGVDRVPVPSRAAQPLMLTVLHVGWELDRVLAIPSWLSRLLSRPGRVVVVSDATVPGMRRLEGSLGLLEHADTVAIVLGPRRRRWPREVAGEMGTEARALERAGRLLGVPQDRRLMVRGLDSTPLPTPLLAAAAHTLRLLEPVSGSAALEGNEP